MIIWIRGKKAPTGAPHIAYGWLSTCAALPSCSRFSNSVPDDVSVPQQLAARHTRHSLESLQASPPPPSPHPRRANEGGSGFLKVCLLLSSWWTTWGLPSAHVRAAHLPNTVIPWGRNSVTQVFFAVCIPLSCKAFDQFFGTLVSSASVYRSLSNQALKCKCLAQCNKNMHE